MSIWQNIILEDAPLEIIDGDRGKNYPSQTDFSDTGFCIFLNAKNVTSNGFQLNNCQFISEQKDSQLRKGKLNRHDIVMTTRGTIGNIAYLHEGIDCEHIRINSGMVIFRTNPLKLLPSFLYSYFRSPAFTSQVNQLRSGVAQPQLPIRDLKKIKIPFPDIFTQSKIADILSKYDEAIANNRRRIELLERSSRLLYREWFVHLRYPGHEHGAIGSDGIPEGWEKKKLEEVGFLNYGKTLKKDDRKGGNFPVFGSGGIIGTHDSFLVEAPGIIVGRKGSIGNVFWTDKHYYPIDTTYFINKEQSNLFLYHALQNIGFINTDVAVPGLNRDFAHSRELTMPKKQILDLFHEFINPIYQQISKLEAINQKLQAARDLLLPRLMNGEINV